jgi:hypothetical protein
MYILRMELLYDLLKDFQYVRIQVGTIDYEYREGLTVSDLLPKT